MDHYQLLFHCEGKCSLISAESSDSLFILTQPELTVLLSHFSFFLFFKVKISNIAGTHFSLKLGDVLLGVASNYVQDSFGFLV